MDGRAVSGVLRDLPVDSVALGGADAGARRARLARHLLSAARPAGRAGMSAAGQRRHPGSCSPARFSSAPSGDESLPTVIPLFPLQDVVRFPDTTRTLYVFEPPLPGHGGRCVHGGSHHRHRAAAARVRGRLRGAIPCACRGVHGHLSRGRSSTTTVRTPSSPSASRASSSPGRTGAGSTA